MSEEARVEESGDPADGTSAGGTAAEPRSDSGGTDAPSPRRWPLIVAGLLVALVVGVAAAGWYYSSDVVVPDHSGGPYDLEIVAVNSGAVAGRTAGPRARSRRGQGLNAGALARSGRGDDGTARTITLPREEATERPGIYALEWEDGRAILGPVLPPGAGGTADVAGTDSADSDEVTRRVLKSGGRAPTGGTKARLSHYVFNGTPKSARGLPYRWVAIRGELGPMPAWQVGPNGRRTWAIFVHGINGSPLGGLRIAPALRAAGLTSLYITYREDERAPPSPDGKHHMGLTEWRDLEAAARYALRHGARRLVLVGYSMGGAIVTQFVERSRLAPRAEAMILDAPALDWQETIAFGARQMGLPSLAAKPVEWAVGLRIDADWEQLDALAHTDELRLPTLLFHGEEDDVVPIETSDEFAAALPGTVTYHRVPRAGHAQSWNVAPARYSARVRAFLRRELGGGRGRAAARARRG
ncbi:MAG TPA: alpha/beta hydrolase [Solirubrobacterales bacterium]|nr:alpha/beta hydrolase [Solirubrobacterales bacterium]